MRGHKGCARCEWPQGKASQLGRNAGIGALSRSGSRRRTLSAVMSAGRNKMGVQCGTGRPFSGGTPPTTHSQHAGAHWYTCRCIHACTHAAWCSQRYSAFLLGIPSHLPPECLCQDNCHACCASLFDRELPPMPSLHQFPQGDWEAGEHSWCLGELRLRVWDSALHCRGASLQANHWLFTNS